MTAGLVIWFTGHSKSGKTTLSKLLFEELSQTRTKVIRLDSDTLPRGIVKPEADTWEEKQRLKNENLTFLSKLLSDNGYIVLLSSVGRYGYWRETLRQAVPYYLEIYVKCPLDVRLQRDATAKYESHADYFHFYEEPECPELTIETDRMNPDESLGHMIRLLRQRGWLPEP